MNNDKLRLLITECYSRSGDTKHKEKQSSRWRDEIEWLAGNIWIAAA